MRPVFGVIPHRKNHIRSSAAHVTVSLRADLSATSSRFVGGMKFGSRGVHEYRISSSSTKIVVMVSSRLDARATAWRQSNWLLKVANFNAVPSFRQILRHQTAVAVVRGGLRAEQTSSRERFSTQSFNLTLSHKCKKLAFIGGPAAIWSPRIVEKLRSWRKL